MGAELVAISPMLTEYTRKMIAKHGLDYPVLLDPGNRAAEKFGLLFQFPGELQAAYRELGIELPRFNGDESWSLPIPARYIIAADGVIVACAISADYRDRPDPEQTLKILGEITNHCSDKR